MATLDASYARQTAEGVFHDLNLNLPAGHIEKELQASFSVYALILNLYAAKLYNELEQTQGAEECNRIDQIIARIEQVSSGTGRPTAGDLTLEEQEAFQQEYQQLVSRFGQLKDKVSKAQKETKLWDEQIRSLAKRILTDWEQLQAEHAAKICELLAKTNEDIPESLEANLTQALSLNVGDPKEFE